MEECRTNNHETLVSSKIVRWFTQRPKWQQVAVKRLLESDDLDDSDISELAKLCEQEVSDEFPDLDCTISPKYFHSQDSEEIRLCSISEITGVNRLAPRKPLDFGRSNIVVIYGSNGSGKSSYVRLLKQVCGSRDCIRGQLHGNVFSDEEVAQKAVISFLRGSSQEEYRWTGSDVCDILCSVEIFDTSFGQVFRGDEGEVSYEPPVLSFFSRLIGVCDRVATKLDANASRLVSRMPGIPPKILGSEGAVWVENLSFRTSPNEVEAHCSFTEENETELRDFERRYSETTPGGKAIQLKTKKGHTDGLVEQLQTYLKELSDENCKKIVAAKQTLIQKELAAKVAAEDVFSDAKLDGVGTQVWKELWNAARKYSEELAYVGQEFPYVQDDGLCVLCHQPLSEEAKERFIGFESYIKDETQKQAADAAKTVEQLVDALPEILNAETLRTKIDAAGIENAKTIMALKDTVNALQDRRSKVQSLESEDGLDSLSQFPECIEEIREISQAYENKAREYETDAARDDRTELQTKIKELLAKKWLSEQKSAIQEEINRLAACDRIDRAKRTTDTMALSKKKGSLSEELITDAFVQRFNDELNNLRAARLGVKLVKQKVSKGKVIHNIQLDGATHKIAEVLSEGEQRVVSIAAFLADVTGRTHPASLVLDDPISSLDQYYEEAVVQRLCDLVSKRQVIIFTHRLPLLGLVQEYAEKANVKPDIVCIRSEAWGTGEPGSTSLFTKRPDKALNALIDNRLPRATKCFVEQGGESYASLASDLCKEFRILLERMIEWKLLADIVQRHRRAVTTRGKIEKLAKISERDCLFFDKLMTKYSRYEHSQSLEAPVPHPEPSELKTDFNKLRQCLKDFDKRPLAR